MLFNIIRCRGKYSKTRCVMLKMWDYRAVVCLKCDKYLVLNDMRNDGYEVVYMFSCSINEVGILFAKRKSNKKKIKRKFHNRKPR